MEKQLSDADSLRLKELNDAVDFAIQQRRQWLDEKMPEYAEMQIGDDVYNLDTCVKVGKVVKHYRYWADRDEGVRDRSLSIDYEIETSPKRFDNTSRQPFKLGSRESAEQRARLRLQQCSLTSLIKNW